MRDDIHTGIEHTGDCRGSHDVACRAFSVRTCLFERSKHFVQFHLRPGLFGMVDIDWIVAGNDLHEISAFQQLLSRRLSHFIRAVSLGIQHVAMSAGDADGRSAGKHARAWQVPRGDQVAKMQPHAER